MYAENASSTTNNSVAVVQGFVSSNSWNIDSQKRVKFWMSKKNEQSDFLRRSQSTKY